MKRIDLDSITLSQVKNSKGEKIAGMYHWNLPGEGCFLDIPGEGCFFDSPCAEAQRFEYPRHRGWTYQCMVYPEPKSGPNYQTGYARSKKEALRLIKKFFASLENDD